MVEIYTDGSCITSTSKELNVGAYVAIIFIDDKKVILKDIVKNTTHNRMELTGVLQALYFLKEKHRVYEKIRIYTDSQYVVQIQTRKDKLKAQNFISAKGTPIQNADLVKAYISLFEKLQPELIKVKAHQKKSEVKNYNREADLLVRKLVRDHHKASNKD